MEEIQNNPTNLCEEVLEHHGILGMKWGVRRYQPYPDNYSGDGKFVGKKSARAERRQARHVAKTNTRIKNAVDTGNKKKLKKYKDEMSPEEYEKKYAETVKNGIDNAVKDRDKSALKKYKDDLNKREYQHQKNRIEFKEAIDNDNSHKTKKLLSKVDPEDVTEATNLIRSRVALQDQKLSKIRQDSELMAKMDKLASGLGKVSKISQNVSSIASSINSVNKNITEMSNVGKEVEKKKKERAMDKIVRSGDLDKILANEKDMTKQQLSESFDRIIQLGDEETMRKAAPYMDNKQITAVVQKLSQMDKLNERVGSSNSSTPETTTTSEASRSAPVQAVRDWLDSGFAASSDRSSASDRHRFLINQESAATTVGEIRSIFGSQASANTQNQNLWWNSARSGSYSITHSDDISYEDVLAHHGKLGMKWGIRRYQPYPDDYTGDGKFVGQAKRVGLGDRKYQNPDGTLTKRGKKRLERERKYGVRNSEYAISIIEKQKKKKEKKADKIASKYADKNGRFKITKPKDAEKHFKLQEKIIEDEKQLKKLRSSLIQLKSMKFEDLSDKDIKQARALSNSIIQHNQQAFQTHLNNIQMQNQINQQVLLQNQMVNQQFMDMVNLQNIQNSINMSMSMMTGPPPMMF